MNLHVWSDTPEQERRRHERAIAKLEDQLAIDHDVITDLLAVAKLFRDELAQFDGMTGPYAEKIARLEEQVNAAIEKAGRE